MPVCKGVNRKWLLKYKEHLVVIVGVDMLCSQKSLQKYIGPAVTMWVLLQAMLFNPRHSAMVSAKWVSQQSAVLCKQSHIDEKDVDKKLRWHALYQQELQCTQLLCQIGAVVTMWVLLQVVVLCFKGHMG